ncbi:MAG: hypothetical protein ACTSVA_07930 [Candidatus Njordarchaeales archaeon]
MIDLYDVLLIIVYLLALILMKYLFTKRLYPGDTVGSLVISIVTVIAIIFAKMVLGLIPLIASSLVAYIIGLWVSILIAWNMWREIDEKTAVNAVTLAFILAIIILNITKVTFS